MNEVTVHWQVQRPDGAIYQGHFTIDANHVASMYAGRPPMEFMQYGADMDYRRRVERADHLSRLIGQSIAADIMQACDPEKKP
jgi:hypothetical protein